MDRRGFLQGAAATAGVAATASSAMGLARLIPAGPQADPDAGWLTVLSRRAPRLDEHDVRRLVERTARLRRLDDFLGGTATVHLYESEARLTERLIAETSHSEGTRRALMTVYGEQVQQAGWAAFDAGMNDRASRHFTASLSAAEEAGDVALAGNSLAFIAYQQAFNLTPDVTLATTSYDRAKAGAPKRVLALLLERLAFTHAVAGDVCATAEALDLARTTLVESSGPPDPDWVFWVDETEIDIMAGRCWSQLHRPLRSIPLLTSALSRYDDAHARDKALYLSWLASAYLDADEPEHAAAVTTQAIDLASGVASERPWARILDLAGRLEAHRGVEGVAAVIDRVQVRPMRPNA